MFGTERAIPHFNVEIRPLSSAEEDEVCRAWGSISYTSEVDFRDETTDDCLWFYLDVKPETFARYVDLINFGGIDTGFFSVRLVDGLYSDWSPGISTSGVKVLLPDEEHQIDLPPDFGDELPRLGRVREARLILQRRLEFSSASSSSPARETVAEPAPAPSIPLQVAPERDTHLAPVLTSLKQATWTAAALLAVIAAAILLRH